MFRHWLETAINLEPYKDEIVQLFRDGMSSQNIAIHIRGRHEISVAERLRDDEVYQLKLKKLASLLSMYETYILHRKVSLALDEERISVSSSSRDSCWGPTSGAMPHSDPGQAAHIMDMVRHFGISLATTLRQITHVCRQFQQPSVREGPDVSWMP
jgi:hypothetical protein